MYLFLLLIIPLSFFIQTSFAPLSGRFVNKSNITYYVFTLVFSLIFTALYSLLIFKSYLPPKNFGLLTVHFYLTETLIPFAVISLILLLFSIKQPDNYLENIFACFAAFASVFIPYRVFSTGITLCAFSLFIKPVLFVLLIIALKLMINACAFSLSNGPAFFILALLVTILFSIVPSLIEAFWYCGGQLYLCITFTILYAGAIYAGKYLFKV